MSKSHKRDPDIVVALTRIETKLEVLEMEIPALREGVNTSNKKFAEFDSGMKRFWEMQWPLLDRRLEELKDLCSEIPTINGEIKVLKKNDEEKEVRLQRLEHQQARWLGSIAVLTVLAVSALGYFVWWMQTQTKPLLEPPRIESRHKHTVR